MDFDDLDEVEGQDTGAQAAAAPAADDGPDLEPELGKILSATGVSDSFKEFMKKQGLLTRQDFFSWAQDRDHLNAKVSEHIKPEPPMKEMLAIRNAWKRCEPPPPEPAAPKAEEQPSAKAPEAAATNGTGAKPAAAGKPLEVMSKQERCDIEMDREMRYPFIPGDYERIQANHMKTVLGMIYGIEFAWSKESLERLGAVWLTKAFRTANTLAKGNSVTKLKDVKVFVGGGNCSKLVFDVEYEKEGGHPPRQLFAKIPYPLEPKLLSDRLASSVMQSGQELMEVHTNRVLEACLPFEIPLYCFGDYSCENTNWCLITERIPFGQQVGSRKYDSAYDKMRDWELQGDAAEYYYLLVREGGKMAGMYKAGKLVPNDKMDRIYGGPSCDRPKDQWGMKEGNSGLGDSEFNSKIKMGVEFVQDTAKALFPADIANPTFMEAYKWCMTVSNQYAAEMMYWSNRDRDYVAWSHGNLNVDNVYFWRESDNALKVGLLDWGGAAISSMGFKLWWWLYCCEYDFLTANFDGLINTFIEEYRAHGGPALDKEKLRTMFILSALAQGVGLLGAVPQIYRMCKKSVWPEIKDRKDPRIAANVDGKNTLRIYIGTFINICHMIRDWGIVELLDKWMDDWAAESKMPRKVPKLNFKPPVRSSTAPVAAAPAAPRAPAAPASGAAAADASAALWQVVGGADKGGVLVRAGEATSSQQLGERLSTGAHVEELELKGERLHYRLLNGSGPAEGWISIAVTGKDLAVPLEVMGPDGPMRRAPPWRVVTQPQIEYAEMKDAAMKDDPGDYYGMKFPCSKDQLEDMGAEWLTKAFHKTGVLPRSNSVTKLKDAKEFVGGGAGLKCTFTVEYQKDEPYLHKKLFAKLPHKPNGSDRYYVSMMWNHDRPEIIFNIFLEKYVPFRVPKFYYGDISATTTNFILITEAIDWAPSGTKSFKPGMVEPQYDKYRDWDLPDGGPMYYLACCRALGKMAGYHKVGRLHPRTSDMFPMPDPISQVPSTPGIDAETRKINAGKADQFIKFVSETAKAVMPDEVTDAAFLAKWKQDMLSFMDYQAEMFCYFSGAGTPNPHDYVGLTHNNLQVDNAFFWRDDDNQVQVGLLDWGVLQCAPLMPVIQGCISGATVEVLTEHRDAFLQAFIDSYAESGGPRLDIGRLRTMCMLSMASWSCSVISNVAQVLKFTKMKEWAEIKDWMDPRLVDRFQVRAHTTQFKEVLQVWKRWDLSSAIAQWKKECNLPNTKS